MAIDFPNSPTTNQIFTSGGKTWVYDGTVWTLRSSLAGPGGITSTELANSSVTTDKIANTAVDTAQLANSSVTSAKIADGTIVNADINSSAAIAYSKLALSNSVLSSDLNTDVQLGYRNVVINGAMQIAQRATSVTGLTTPGTTGYHTVDRFAFDISSFGTWTQDIQNDAPTGSGFRKSLRMLCTTADASPAAGDYVIISNRIEGQNLQQFAKGTSSAKQFTLSFWVKSNATGTYIVELADNDNTRRVSSSYTVSASATWEKKTITFPADTTGAFDNDNALSLLVQFYLGAGSNFSGGASLQTTWGTGSNTRAVGQVNVAAATNNYWQITGVQLEAGAVATPFEFEDYGMTLAKCQRYFQIVGDNTGTSDYNIPMIRESATQGQLTIWLPVSLRAVPTLYGSSLGRCVFRDTSFGVGVGTVSAITFNTSGPSLNAITLIITHGSVGGSSVYAEWDLNNTPALIGFSAEL